MEKVNELTNDRKLATIARIEEIKEIPEALNIQHARVRGWWVVVKRDEFKVGDLCVYAEVDSVFPDGLLPEVADGWRLLNKLLSKAASDHDKQVLKDSMEEISKLNPRQEFEFLRSSKFRIKTKRIFGEISQGIVFPLSILPTSYCHTRDNKPIVDDNFIENVDCFSLKEWDEGDDVTSSLGVTQFVPPDPAVMGGDAKGDMQNVGLLISDEERLENLRGKYETMRFFQYYKTEKLEGTSFTAYLKDGKFGVTGRTIEFKVPEENTPLDQLNVYWKMAKKLDIENKMREINVFGDVDGQSWEGVVHKLDNIALQGELIGEGIQGNIYKLKGQQVRFYNAWLIDKQEYLKYDTFIKLINGLRLDTVPILDDNYTLPEDSMDLLKEADVTYSVLNPAQLIEGFVYIARGIMPKEVRVARSVFNRLSFKAKSRTYDMKKA
jgi:RNA ligase (TIGR02306 family)